jgi:hypothetical protein
LSIKTSPSVKNNLTLGTLYILYRMKI